MDNWPDLFICVMRVEKQKQVKIFIIMNNNNEIDWRFGDVIL